ncbi:MAG: amidohydrolase family protein [Anaerolineae bacterium]|nr:amidohydrolase family protein [Anaerolineae bacterium]MBN8618262.1 amidohydrolase family protein [Anaerolineae bacterium]
MTNLLRIPGMIDPHVHMRDLEWAHKATFASETAAALAGGYWMVMDMPNTPPVTTTRPAVEQKRAAMQAQAVCDWGFYIGASQDGNEAEYPYIAPLACGLKIYNNATTGTLLIEDQAVRERHYQAWPHGKPIAVHAEDETVDEILALVRQYRKHTHFCHISTQYEIETLRAAKAEGLPISVGVTPHHLYLVEDDIKHLGTLGHMKPTLKRPADRDALWAGIADGVVDVVESDHAPHTLEEKQSSKPPYGVPGLETTLPLMGLAVHEKRITVERLIDLLALNAQRIWRLTPDAATYTLVELESPDLIERSRLRSRCGWSPFEGMKVYGKVREVWIRGTQVYDGEAILVAQGFGRNGMIRDGE